MSADTEKTTTEMKPVPAEGSIIPPRLIPVTDIYAEPELRVPPSSADALLGLTDPESVLNRAAEIIDLTENLPDAEKETLRRALKYLWDAACDDRPAPPNNPARFPDMDVGINLGPTVAARVQIASTDGKGWTLAEFRRLVAFLELQRSFLADEPLNVTVHFGTPR